jgi:DNA-binding NtrC family response regulator
LRIVELKVPPLRARGEDVLVLARRFLDTHATRYGRGPLTLSREAEDLLRRHRWPGNVRELRNLMEQAVLLSPGDVLAVEDLHLSPVPLAEAAGPAAAAPEAGMRLEDAERNLLVNALQKTGYNVTQAARLLGITRDTLRYRMEKHAIGPGGGS